MIRDDASVEIWDSLYLRENYAPIAPYTEIISFLSRSFGREGKGRKVLEIGCGTGQNLLYASWRMGFEVYGIDYSEEAISQAREHFSRNGLSYGSLKVGDASQLPYPDEYFDGLVERATLQQNRLEVAQRIINEMCRVLKPGGVMCCSMAAEGHFLFGQGDYLGDGDFFNGEHDGTRHFFSRRDILELFPQFEIKRWMLHSRSDLHANRIVEQYHYIEVSKKLTGEF